MTKDELTADMLDPDRQREAAMSRCIDRAKFAKANGEEPDAAWSMGEKLMIALVFQSSEQLEALGYSEAEAEDRLRYDFGASSAEFPQVLDRIRSEL